MSAAIEPQVVEPIDFSGLDEYELSGNEVTVTNKRMFLAAYRGKATVYHAAQVAGISRKTVYQWLRVDEAFIAAFDDCKEDAADTLETSVYQRALKSDLLAMFWLKAHRAKFRDRMTIDLPALENELTSRFSRNITPQTAPVLESAKKSSDE